MSSLKATVLEEMPPFPERESSILAKLKKKKKEKAGILDKEEKNEPAEKPTANGQVPVANEVYSLNGVVFFRRLQHSLIWKL